MATPRDYAQSVMAALVLVQNAPDESLYTVEVTEILRDMDGLADELRDVLG